MQRGLYCHNAMLILSRSSSSHFFEDPNLDEQDGDVIKEGQVIRYVEQFGTELPVKLDVRGEVFKILFIVWLYYQLDSIGIGHCLFRRSHI
ncbi:hypothetical protein FEM48_Zijuj02G0061600 [Ziziphus jujuba var. spinosa]|uniref:Uncharacterized protein n=1 Tax=Ziziphus jujuba var. spinosa TaxID=714518 RepID=A0A978VU30_ZIZJJ|nr:hypothetical protein FEM48_Zijuj02G0061600 [Ziziphus jujuba var. spinosa]